MGLPSKQAVGNILSARWLNDHRGETEKNTVRAGAGIRVERNNGGTVISKVNLSLIQRFPGSTVSVLNKTNRDLDAYMVAGIERTTLKEENLTDSIESGIRYILRKPRLNDIHGGFVILAEAIEKDEAGLAYISSDGMLARVKFTDDQDPPKKGAVDSDGVAVLDNFIFASLEIEDPETSSTADKLFQLTASSVLSPVRILERKREEEKKGKFNWCIIRFGQYVGQPRVFKATEDSVTVDDIETIKVKAINADGTLVGSEIEMIVLPS